MFFKPKQCKIIEFKGGFELVQYPKSVVYYYSGLLDVKLIIVDRMFKMRLMLIGFLFFGFIMFTQSQMAIALISLLISLYILVLPKKKNVLMIVHLNGASDCFHIDKVSMIEISNKIFKLRTQIVKSNYAFNRGELHRVIS